MAKRKAKTPEEKLATLVAALFALMGSANTGERDNARAKLDELLSRHRKTWNDIPDLLQIASALDARADPYDERAKAASSSASSGAEVGALDLVHRMLELYIWMEPHELVAAALWILHCHVHDRFMVSPRLALTSPVRGCGKTTALDIAERLTPRAPKTDNITPAAIYHLVDRERCSLFVDEADNLWPSPQRPAAGGAEQRPSQGAVL